MLYPPIDVLSASVKFQFHSEVEEFSFTLYMTNPQENKLLTTVFRAWPP